MKTEFPKNLHSLLLRWFRKKKRALPWRETKDPYKIWISEIMLQQTQVNTVLPYYDRWMKKFPAIGALARASLTTVLKAWEGLGYYSRARNLHRTAKIICKNWNGKFPDSKEELIKLPGIGRYTAGAIASIAFGKPEPVLDGNVKRVLARIFALREPIDTSRGEKKLWEIAERMVGEKSGQKPKFNPGDLNQALMELGALVCVPENPQCSVCPVEKLCGAHRLKKERFFPLKSRNRKLEKLETLATILWKNGRVLLEKQSLKNRWGGLWMFPHWIYGNGKPEQDFLKEKIKKDLGLGIRGLRSKAEIEHGFTKYRVHLRVYEGQCRGGVTPPAEGAETAPLRSWVDVRKLSRLPLPSPHQKIAELIQRHD